MASMADFAAMRKALWNAQGYFILENAVPEDLMTLYERTYASYFLSGQPLSDNNEYVLNLVCGEKIYNVISTVVDSSCVLQQAVPSLDLSPDCWLQYASGNNHAFADNSIGVYIALEDYNDAKSTIQYIDGSHLWKTVTVDTKDDMIKPNESSIRDFKGKRGDAFFFHGSTLFKHEYADSSVEVRSALVAFYSSQSVLSNLDDVTQYKSGWYKRFEVDHAQ